MHVPFLVLRDRTERTEGIDAGAGLLVGTDVERIIAQTEHMLRDEGAGRRRPVRATRLEAGKLLVLS